MYDAINNTECVRDVLFFREHTRLAEQSVNMFMFLQYPLETTTAATLIVNTGKNSICGAKITVYGTQRDFDRCMKYTLGLLSIAKAVAEDSTIQMHEIFLDDAMNEREIGSEERYQWKSYQSARRRGRVKRGLTKPPPKNAKSIRKTVGKLEKRAPDLFVMDYARRCQSERQPLAIDDNEVEYWRQKKVLDQDRQLQRRQIIEMDTQRGKLKLVCPSDELPYPHFN